MKHKVNPVRYWYLHQCWKPCVRVCPSSSQDIACFFLTQKNAVRDLRGTRTGGRRKGAQGHRQRGGVGMRWSTPTPSWAALRAWTEVGANCAQQCPLGRTSQGKQGKGTPRDGKWPSNSQEQSPRSDEQEGGELIKDESSLKYVFTEYLLSHLLGATPL